MNVRVSALKPPDLPPVDLTRWKARISPAPLAHWQLSPTECIWGLWDNLRQETGIDFQNRIVELTKVAFSESELPALEESLDTFNGAENDGFSGEKLDRQQLLELEPRLSSAVLCGVGLRGNAALDSLSFTRALAAAAQGRGASVLSESVRGVKLESGRVKSVILDNREIACGSVVLAAGPWSREIEPWLDISVPVDPLKGEILRLRADGPQFTTDFSGGGSSLYPKPDGLVWCGATEEWRGFDREPSEAAQQEIWAAAIKLIPDLAEAELVRHTACLRPVTSDWLPIIGQAPGWENVFLATGAGKKGILLSPAIGKATADLMTQGKTVLSIGSCSPSRFLLSAQPGDAGSTGQDSER